MENEQEQIKINNYDINMLIGIYFYDQGTIQLSKLAERLCAPENEVELILAEYRESPVYKDFYAEMRPSLMQDWVSRIRRCWLNAWARLPS